MRTKIYVILFFAFLIFFGCEQKDKQPHIYIDRFYKNEEGLNHLIEALRKDTFLEDKWGDLIERNKFNNAIKQKLYDLSIDSVHLFSCGHKQKQFDFITNWGQKNSMHLYYNTLDSVQTEKGFYKKDEYLNETWGLGNHWALSIVKKYIETMQ
ncbi:MAG: hypothetical protein ABJB05_06800 [Parafilimonas sp.]